MSTAKTGLGGFFAGRRMLVTGVAGVKGAWLAQLLLDAGAEVVGLDIRPSASDRAFVASGLGRRITVIEGDCADIALMSRLAGDVDGVFHLAAVSIVLAARRDPLEAYRTNTYGTAVVLDAVRRARRDVRTVVITTDKVYKPNGGVAWTEDDPLFASEPYPISKACAEEITADYHRGYLAPVGRRAAVGRAGNVILGGDFHSSRLNAGAGHLHVDCFEALIAGEQPVVFNPFYTRPYTYGLDILTGYMSMMARLDEEAVDGEAFNFGPRENPGLPNGVVATRICDIWGGESWVQGDPRAEPFEAQSLDWAKAQRRLGWRPVYTIDDTLTDVADWYRAWADRGQGEVEGVMADVNAELVARHRDAARRAAVWWASPLD
jgi:CDP-glucose 4,6-dehydratase